MPASIFIPPISAPSNIINIWQNNRNTNEINTLFTIDTSGANSLTGTLSMLSNVNCNNYVILTLSVLYGFAQPGDQIAIF